MPFVRSPNPRYFAPASFNVLNGDGQLIVSKFDCEFKRLKFSEQKRLQTEMGQWGAEVVQRLRKRAEELSAAVRRGESIPDTEASAEAEEAVDDLVNRRLLERVMVGWRAVEGPDGAPLEFSLKAVDETEEEFPGFINACAVSFWKSTQPAEAAHLAAKN